MDDTSNEIAREPPKQWRTLVLYVDIDTGEIIIARNPLDYWTPIKKEIHVYERKRTLIREILYLCQRSRQLHLAFDI